MPTYGTRDWTQRSAVAATFQSKSDAEAAIRSLKEKGFKDENIGFAMRDNEGHNVQTSEHVGTHAGAGAATGAVTGGVLGAIAGLLVGIGALAIPGIGPVITGGVLASTFGVAGGATAAGAAAGIIAGGIIGALIGMGIPKHEAEYFDHQVREGRALVTVAAEGRADEAAYIMERHGGDTGANMYDPVPAGSNQAKMI